MEWWASLFDQDYVEAWTAAGAFDRTAEQAGALVALLGLPLGARILDVPCGFGRIAGYLHERGYEVTGIDLSEAQIQLAKERHAGPRYLQRDMRDPPEGPYDAVLNIYSSFGYFEDREDDLAALRAWFRVLRPGGVLVMELAHRDQVAHAYGDESATAKGPVHETGTTDWVTGLRTSTVTFRTVVKQFRIRLYTATELVTELRGIGFESIDVWGDLDAATPPSPRTRLVIRAVKEGTVGRDVSPARKRGNQPRGRRREQPR